MPLGSFFSPDAPNRVERVGPFTSPRLFFVSLVLDKVVQEVART